jgi:hypothetical protein
MAQILKPTNLSLTWASGGDVLNPGDTKYATGWQVEIPPRQWFNYLDNRQDTAIAHINQHGVVVWDNTTEYQEDKSYVQGVTNGTIYRCVQTHTNQNPETDVSNTYWIIAFASAGDFYTKAEVDSNFLAKASNLSDLPNTADARTNLSVYSQAQTYTKTEVDAKTAVASTAQAQARTSNTMLLTPLRLDEAFKGANQSLTTNGYQRLPGGVIEQWGTTVFASISAGQKLDILQSYPITFPTTTLAHFVSVVTSDPQVFSVSFVRVSNSQFRIYLHCDAGVYSNVPVEWRLLGK